MSEFSKLLSKYRKDSKKTMVELSKVAGISQPYISQLESGNREPTEQTISSIAHGLAEGNNEKFALIYDDLFQALKRDSLKKILSDKELMKFMSERSISETDAVNFAEEFNESVISTANDKIVDLMDLINSDNKHISIHGEPLSQNEKEVLHITLLGIIEYRNKLN